jgi:hypothetical protein
MHAVRDAPSTTIYYFFTPYILKSKVLIRQVYYLLKLSRWPVPGPGLRGRYKWWSNRTNVTITDTLLLPTGTGTKDPVVRFIAVVIVQGDHVSCQPTRTRSGSLLWRWWRWGRQCGSRFLILYLEPEVIIHVHIPKALSLFFFFLS